MAGQAVSEPEAELPAGIDIQIQVAEHQVMGLEFGCEMVCRGPAGEK
jgi:hypothetical protein